MTVWGFILLFFIILVGGILILSGKARVLLRAFIDLFVEDVAKSPEGAAALYGKAIDDAENNYKDANDCLQKLEGQFYTLNNDIRDTKKALEKCENNCEVLAKNNKFKELELFAEERESLILKLDSLHEMHGELESMVKDAREVNNLHELNVKKLKEEKVRVISNLKNNIQMKAAYDSLNKLKKSSNTDKLIGVVNDHSNSLKEMAVGAREVYENQTSTKINKAKKDIESIKTEEYIKSLKSKYIKEM